MGSPADSTPRPRWQHATRPWTAPRPVLPTWAVALRWTCMCLFLLLVLLGALAPALVALLLSILVDSAVGRRSPSLPLPRLGRGAVVLATCAVGIPAIAGAALRLVPLVVLAALVAGSVQVARNRVARAAAA